MYIDLSFVCIKAIFVPLENFSLIWRRHHYWWTRKEENIVTKYVWGKVIAAVIYGMI